MTTTGILWPDTPSLPTTVAPSPRILNASVREIFLQLLDKKLEILIAGSWSLSTLSLERAGQLQGSIVQVSVQLGQELSPPKFCWKTGKGNRFKDGYSPEFLLLRAALHAYIHISRLLWQHVHRRRLLSNIHTVERMHRQFGKDDI